MVSSNVPFTTFNLSSRYAEVEAVVRDMVGAVVAIVGEIPGDRNPNTDAGTPPVFPSSPADRRPPQLPPLLGYSPGHDGTPLPLPPPPNRHPRHHHPSSSPLYFSHHPHALPSPSPGHHAQQPRSLPLALPEPDVDDAVRLVRARSEVGRYGTR